MKKLLTLSILSILTIQISYSQDSLYLKGGEKLYGSVINIGNKKVYFEDADTGDRKRYKKVERVVDFTDDERVEFIIRDIKGLTSDFSGEIVKGKVSLYVTYKYIPGGGVKQANGMMVMGGYTPFYYLLKETGKLTRVMPNSLTTPFAKKMIKYFSGCSELTKKIKSKTYTYDNLKDIVEHYNTNCAN